jgi:hypothetical protein
VDENVLAILALDESVAFGCVKPFHCAFFFHVLPFSAWYCNLISSTDRQKKWGARLFTRANPHSSIWRKNDKSQMHKHYTQNRPTQPPVPRDGTVILKEHVQLQFFRLRFHFEALDPIRFPSRTTSNMVRGALGTLLRGVACTPRCGAAQHDAACGYVRIFEPRGTGPSGFAERPRPFVLRTRHLDGCSLDSGESFFFDIHLFDLTDAPLSYFIQALARLGDEGLGAGRKHARLQTVEQISLAGDGLECVWNGGVLKRPPEPCTVSLDGDGIPATSARVRFVTPTELKFQNTPADRPEFAVLFARIRDRVNALRSFYGPAPLDIDFRAMGERASRVELTRCELHNEHAQRRSSRTGQVHPLGGFTGEAEYRGDLAEFLPYLRAARWTGVGRQTVWGKGEIQLL